jgi:threonine synthase
MYFQNSFPPEYGVSPDPAKANAPLSVLSMQDKQSLTPEAFTLKAAEIVASRLGVERKR